jgi:acyl carrier protein
MKKSKIILDKINSILKNNFNLKNKVTKNLNLTRINHWDSIKHLDFIMCLEKEFDKKFDLKNNFNLKTVSDFIKILEK